MLHYFKLYKTHGPVDILVPPNDNDNLLDTFKRMGISSSVILENIQELIDKEAEALKKANAKGINNRVIDHMEWDRYYDIFDALGYVDYLASGSSVIVLYIRSPILSKDTSAREFKKSTGSVI